MHDERIDFVRSENILIETWTGILLARFNPYHDWSSRAMISTEQEQVSLFARPFLGPRNDTSDETHFTVTDNSRTEEEPRLITLCHPLIDFNPAHLSASHPRLFTTSWRATCRPTRRAMSATSASSACAPTPRSKSGCCSPTGCRWRTDSASFSPPCPSPRDQCCRSGPPPRWRPAWWDYSWRRCRPTADGPSRRHPPARVVAPAGSGPNDGYRVGGSSAPSAGSAGSSAARRTRSRCCWASGSTRRPRNRRPPSRPARFRSRCRNPVRRRRRSPRWRRYRTRRCCSRCSGPADRTSCPGDRSRCRDPMPLRYGIPTRPAVSTGPLLCPEVKNGKID